MITKEVTTIHHFPHRISLQTTPHHIPNQNISSKYQIRYRWYMHIYTQWRLGTDVKCEVLYWNHWEFVKMSECRSSFGGRDCNFVTGETARVWEICEEVDQGLCQVNKKIDTCLFWIVDLVWICVGFGVLKVSRWSRWNFLFRIEMDRP